MTRDELVSSLRHEIHILRHLAGKITPDVLGYRPTALQRSTLELLRYLAMMGPALVEVTRSGAFDAAAWTVLERGTEAFTLDEAMAAIAAQADTYARAIGGMSDEELRGEIAPFGYPTSRGAFLVNQVLAGHAAYRTQIFLYLKACGRSELGTSNLWGGADPAPRG